MSEIEIQSVLTPDFTGKLTLLGEDEQKRGATLPDYIRPLGENDPKSNIDANSAVKNVDQENVHVAGDAKPPQCLLNVRTSKQGQELADDIAEKIRRITLKREQLIKDIVERCQKHNNKVIKNSEKMAARRIQMCEKVDKELEHRRNQAEKKREKIYHDNLERIQKHMEYVKVVQNNKLSNNVGMFGDAIDTYSKECSP